MGLVIGISDSAAFTSPPVLIRRRAMAMATFSLPWKYLLATSDDIFIFTLGSQSTSSVHSQCRLPSSPRPARMFTTRSTSSNSNRWGTSASRSFGPIAGSSLIIENTRSMTSRNCLGESNSGLLIRRPSCAPGCGARARPHPGSPRPARRSGGPAPWAAPARGGRRGGQPRELPLHALEPLGARAGAAGASQALVEPVEAVLDALEALRDRPHPAGEALDVGGRRDAQRPHRHPLGLGRLLLRVERAREGPVEQRVLEHVLGELADRILTLAGDPLLQAFRGGLVGHRASLRSLVEAAPL